MAWQFSVASVLVNNGSLAVVGLALLHLAAYLDPGDPRWEARCVNVRRWAILAALGFLLLAFLQAGNTYRGLRNASQGVPNQQRQIAKAFFQLRQAISTAPDANELQSRLRALSAPMLSPAELAQPMPQLRQQLLASLKQAEAAAKANAARGAAQIQIEAFLKDGLRTSLSSLAYALAFAAAGKRARWPNSLLDHLTDDLKSFVSSRPAFLKNWVKSFSKSRKIGKLEALRRRSLKTHQAQKNRVKKEQESRDKHKRKYNSNQ